MRKSLAVMALFLLSCSSLLAQYTKGKAAFGVKTGINLSTFRPAIKYDNYDPSFKVGFVLGGFVEIPVSPRFAIQPEFLYSQLGANAFDGLNNYGDIKLKYNYFSIPILAKYKATKRLTFIAGVENDFLIRARKRDDLDHEVNVSNDIKDFDFVYTAGAEFWFNDHLVGGARYLHGSQDVSITNDNSTFFNQGVQVTIGYKFSGRVKKPKTKK